MADIREHDADEPGQQTAPIGKRIRDQSFERVHSAVAPGSRTFEQSAADTRSGTLVAHQGHGADPAPRCRVSGNVTRFKQER